MGRVARALRGQGASLGHQVLHRPGPCQWPHAQDHPRALPRDGHRAGPEGGRRHARAPVERRGRTGASQDQGAAVPRLRRPIPRTAQASLEAGLAQDLRQLHAEPADARLRQDAARCDRPCPRVGMVRRGERGQARRRQPRLRGVAGDARRGPPVGRAGRARPRRLRQHRQEPPQARGALSRPRRARTPRQGPGQAPGRTPLAGRGDPAADADGRAALRNARSQVGRDRRARRGRRECPARRFQDRTAHRLARAGSGKGSRGAAPERKQRKGVPRGSHVAASLHVLVRHPRESRAARASHPRLPAYPGPRRA